MGLTFVDSIKYIPLNGALKVGFLLGNIFCSVPHQTDETMHFVPFIRPAQYQYFSSRNKFNLCLP